jgi:hypothetical protein
MADLGHDVAEFSSVGDMVTVLGQRPVDGVVVDLTQGTNDGLGCVHEVLCDVPILLLGTPADMNSVVAAAPGRHHDGEQHDHPRPRRPPHTGTVRARHERLTAGQRPAPMSVLAQRISTIRGLVWAE